jgi:hypothetical protein
VAAVRPPRAHIDLGARARLAALDGFDARARPASDRLRPDYARAPRSMRCRSWCSASKPQQRSDRQPVRVIHNGRFSLPAGTYDDRGAIQRSASTVARLPLSLQIGRNGPPLQTWTLQPQAGQRGTPRCGARGCQLRRAARGPVELERDIESITITPKP